MRVRVKDLRAGEKFWLPEDKDEGWKRELAIFVGLEEQRNGWFLYASVGEQDERDADDLREIPVNGPDHGFEAHDERARRY